MAKRSDIEKLLKKVTITIDKDDLIEIVDNERIGKLKKGNRIEDVLLNNAEYVDMKKLVTIVVRRLQLLLKQYEESHISGFLERDVRMQLQNAITLAKSYVSSDEKIMISDTENIERNIITSKEIIYGIKEEKEKFRYDEIKEFIPKIDKQGIKELPNWMKQIFNEDDYISRAIAYLITSCTLIEQGYPREEIDSECLGCIKIFEKMEDFSEKIDVEIFDRILNYYLNNEGIKANIDADKYLLFNIKRINEKLERQEELEEDEKRFLENIENLVESVDDKTKIRTNPKTLYDKKQISIFLSKLNTETLEYATEEQLKTGEKLLQDTNGYEEYLKKEQILKLAKIEENLLFLAKSNKISNGNIMKILYQIDAKENTLIELYLNGNMSLEQLEKYGKEKGIEIEEIKSKIKEMQVSNLSEVDIEDKNIWQLLSEDEKILAISAEIDKGNTKYLEKFKELYSLEKIAQLYKEIYIENNTERKEIYEVLIKIHNLLGNKNNDEIINLLEDEFSNDMLLNLYNDNLISIELLESYAGEELIAGVFKEGKIHEEDIKQIIKIDAIKLTEEQILDLYQKGNITLKEIKELYIKDKIRLETLKKLNATLPENEKIETLLEENELLSIYKQSKENEKQQNEYQRYRLLYQALKDGKLDKDLLKKCNLYNEEDVIQLYRDNMLDLNALLEFGGEELVQKLAEKLYLTPSDAKKFFEDKEGKSRIEKILQNTAIEDIEKIILIYSTFADDKEMRDELVKYLQAHSSDIANKENSKTRRQPGEEKEKSKESNTDPYERWRLFLALDKNYTMKYVDGYVIVDFNSMQKTIIEKMYKKYKGQICPAYGVATFDIDTDEFKKIESQIIKDERLDIAILRTIAKEHPEIVGKTTHHPPVKDKDGNEKTSWGKRIVEKVAGKDLEEIYTEDEQQKIEDCLRAIEASREVVER